VFKEPDGSSYGVMMGNASLPGVFKSAEGEVGSGRSQSLRGAWGVGEERGEFCEGCG
jgi:hypothetical protein